MPNQVYIRLKTTLTWLGLSLLSVILLLLLVNAFDQDIKPEVLTFVDFSSEVVPPEQNAYPAILGHFAPVNEDPHRKGMEILAVHNEIAGKPWVYDPTGIDIRDKVLGANKLVFQGKATDLCERNAERCLPAYAAKAREIEDLLRNNRTLARRYYALYEYPHFRETAKDSVNILIFSDDANMNALLRAEIGLKAVRGQSHEALQMLARDLKFQRMRLRESRTLIAKMMAVAAVRRELSLLSEIMSAKRFNVAEAKLTEQMLKPLDRSELDMHRIFRAEFAVVKVTLESIPLDADAETAFDYVARVFFKRNATINLMYERHRTLAMLSQLSADDFVNRLKSSEVDEEQNARWLHRRLVYNPVGGTLFGINTVGLYTGYIGRVHNLDALMRLVRLQLLANKQRVRNQDIEQFLISTDPAFTNPYTKEPARWDRERRSLRFIGMREGMDGELMSKKIEVFL